MTKHGTGLAALALALAAGWLWPTPAAAQVLTRLENAVTVFDEATSGGDASIPEDLLKKAECVVIVPGLKKGAIGIGFKYGRGFVSCRSEDGWSPPAGIRMEGGSYGFQIGGAEVDVILTVMNKRGVDRLLSSKFTLGADASVAAGPVGRSASAQTDAMMTAEILSWSRSRGIFAGIALGGSTLRGDDDANKDLYGKKVRVRDIVTGGLPAPAAASALLERLAKY
ncbi:MAG TPA: lipid-binding SYLF domain-containing protein [Vicinamibacterales bacterium]|nr:lipid-binding SYLF domain-containing protein [Vicinamibacterales bacterium]HOG29435.1 lipid-binding SYLF domain-containing protein [Vicinamibacterales bacterium]HPK71818.1 lipid-binding SYLF domain-containing protein [Vicinamibacterales bacterium]HPW20473.1 lipid-binding SYLF domain-containing protein [Vicinamibacterales bacterium]